MDTELKPCPFCGEEAGICEANDICFHRDDDGNKIFGGWRCFCPSCAIEQIGYETREEAVSAWNNRSTEHATHRAPVDEKGGGRMTGIDRLRTLAGAWDEWGLGGALMDVADQIERERACDADTIENVRLILGGVVDEMESHCLGHEGMEDSPVARWARELREALGGKECDLMDEDREAIAWVRDHGGLDSVKKLLDWVVGHCSTKQQLDFDFWLSGRVMYELGFEEDMADRDEVERRLLARLMPEGYEWPRYEDRKPVRIGDVVSDVEVRSVVFREDGIIISDCTSVPGWGAWRSYKEPIKRPTPKVLDADGVEIYKGRIAYGTRGRKYRVTELCEYEPSIVHAQAIDDGELGDEFIAANTGLNSYQLDASKLTHERPDSWERLEEDAGKDPCGYFGFDGEETCGKCPASGKNCEQTMARDLVRRARALAERERGE